METQLCQIIAPLDSIAGKMLNPVIVTTGSVQSVVLPPPLIVTLKKGLDEARRNALIEQIQGVKGVIHALPQAHATADVLAVLYLPGSKVLEELNKMNGVSSVSSAPTLPRNPRPPSP